MKTQEAKENTNVFKNKGKPLFNFLNFDIIIPRKQIEERVMVLAKRKRITVLEEVQRGLVYFKRWGKGYYSMFHKNTNPHSPDFGKFFFYKNMSRFEMLKALGIKQLKTAAV